MTIDGENISLKINDFDLGVIFTSKLLLSQNLYSAVFIPTDADQVSVLKGAVISISKTSEIIIENEEIRTLRKMLLDEKANYEALSLHAKQSIKEKELKMEELMVENSYFKKKIEDLTLALEETKKPCPICPS